MTFYDKLKTLNPAIESESESHSVVFNSLQPRGLESPRNSPGQNTGMGSLFLLHWIFQTQGSNPGLLHHRWILYQQSHNRSPRILEWVAYPFSSRSSQPRNWTRVSWILGGFFFKYKFIYFNWRLITLQYCIGFAIHQHEPTELSGNPAFKILRSWAIWNWKVN